MTRRMEPSGWCVTTFAWTETAFPSRIASAGGGLASSPVGTGSETRATAATGTGAGLVMVNRTSPAIACETASTVKANIARCWSMAGIQVVVHTRYGAESSLIRDDQPQAAVRGKALEIGVGGEQATAAFDG
jgi:hypothetical protein